MAHDVVSRAPRGEEDLEPVAPDGRAGVAVRAAEFGNQDGRTEHPFVPRPCGRVDVPPLVGTRRIILPGEVEGREARHLVLEVRRASVLKGRVDDAAERSEEHTSELQSLAYLVCRLLLEKKKKIYRLYCQT